MNTGQRLRVLFASRPIGRDCPKDDRLRVTKDLDRLCTEIPWVTISHKPHPSECAFLRAAGLPQPLKPGHQLHHLPSDADLDVLLANSDLVVAWPSTVLFEAVHKGVPAAILEYGWRRHLAVIPACFPVVTCFSDLVLLCKKVRREGKPMWEEQFSHVKDSLEVWHATPADVVEDIVGSTNRESAR